MIYILGISGLYHDSAACIVKNGDIVAAAQEERFTRKKHDYSFPYNAIAYCLKETGIEASDLYAVVFYDNPALTLDRFIKNCSYEKDDNEDLIKLQLEPLIKSRLNIDEIIRAYLGDIGINGKLYVTKHHISHAASAFYPSPYNDAMIITNDGVGEWQTTTIGVGNGNSIKILKEINYPDSIGMLYSAFTYFCGFKVNSGDYKLMGLASYGKPKYLEIIKDNIIDIKEDGSYKLNMNFFDYQYGRSMTNNKFAELFGGQPRTQESRITKREMDMAASVQQVIEEILIKQAKTAKKLRPEINNLVLAGGVALNCVANGKLLREKIFDNIWIQPAAGDAGGAMGAALFFWYQFLNKPRIVDDKKDSQKGSFLGPSYDENNIRDFLDSNGCKYTHYSEAEIYEHIAEELAQDRIVGVLQGRMEFGPRALGGRSILANPTSEKMQSKLNLKIKYRESFRPFAPAVIENNVSDYFEMDISSPYMLLCADVKKERRRAFDLSSEISDNDEDLIRIINNIRSDIPAVTHVDYSARIQTVTKEANNYFYRILEEFYKKTGCPVLINTSFNVRGEPIVCSPEDAYKCFMRTEMDTLVLENFVLRKEDGQPFNEKEDWRKIYALD